MVNTNSENPLEKTSFQWVSMADRLLVWGEPVPFPPLSAGTWCGLNLCRSCVYSSRLCEFLIVEVLLYQENTVSFMSSILLAPTIFLLPLPHRSLSPGGRGLMETSDLGPSTPKFVTLSLHIILVCVSMSVASTAGGNSSKCWLCRCVCFMKTH